ncbi:MAG: ribonuclease P protein component [Acidimicrobiales bacterium]
MTAGAGTQQSRRAGTGPIRSRITFEELRRTRARGRSGPISVSYLEQRSWSEPQVAYGISRRLGNAVVRNRLRRRLRAIMLEEAPSLPAGAYVVHVGPSGPTLEFDELKVAMSQALERATRQASGRRSPTGAGRPGAAR